MARLTLRDAGWGFLGERTNLMKNYRKTMFRMQPVARLSSADLAKLRLTFEPVGVGEGPTLNEYDEASRSTQSPAESRRQNTLAFESRREGRLVFKPFADLIPPNFRGTSVERQRAEVVSLIG
jgi:hypothetical protein